MKIKTFKSDALLDWDIEPRPKQNPDRAPEFRAVRVKRGMGRYNTRSQAGRAAAIASGNICDESVVRIANEFAAIARERDRQEADARSRDK